MHEILHSILYYIVHDILQHMLHLTLDHGFQTVIHSLLRVIHHAVNQSLLQVNPVDCIAPNQIIAQGVSHVGVADVLHAHGPQLPVVAQAQLLSTPKEVALPLL